MWIFAEESIHLSCNQKTFWNPARNKCTMTNVFGWGTWSCWTIRNNWLELFRGSWCSVQIRWSKECHVYPLSCYLEWLQLDSNVCSYSWKICSWTEENEHQRLCTNTQGWWYSNEPFKTAEQLLNKDVMTKEVKFFKSKGHPLGFNISRKQDCVWRSENGWQSKKIRLS